MKRLIILGFCVGGILAAQEGPRPQSYIKTFPLLKALDTDHDGIISAAEIAAAPESLRELDRDGDDKLTPQECADGSKRGPSPRDMVKMLMAFDKNGDGKLQRDELPERLLGLFDRGDLDHDGVLTPDEVRKLARAEQPVPAPEPHANPAQFKRTERMIMRVSPVLAALDTDHNAEISSAEMDNAAASLKTLDKNGDGRLTDDEVTPDPLRMFAAQLVVVADTDSDGRVSDAEMQAGGRVEQLRATLLAADRSHRGFVTEEDIMAEIRLRVHPDGGGAITQAEIQHAVQAGVLGKP